MSSLKEVINRYHQAFISMDEVLRRLAALDGDPSDETNYKQAAKTLCYLLKSTHEPRRPVWQQLTETKPMTPLPEVEIPRAMDALERAAIHGFALELPPWDEFGANEEWREAAEYHSHLPSWGILNQNGFSREEMMAFLEQEQVVPPEQPLHDGLSLSNCPNTFPDLLTLLDEPLATRLRACLNESEIASLQQLFQSVNTRCAQLEQRAVELAAQREASEAARAELEQSCEQLKMDELKGKKLRTALLLIGGMATEAYEIKLHEEPFRGIKALVQGLESAGAAVDVKTVRTWLREAAAVLRPPDKKPPL